MSMLTAQTERLRKAADFYDGFKAANLMREAADTIENLCNRLTETCELEINTDMTAVKCSMCGYVVPKGTDLMSVRYCAGCGRQVVE